MVVKLLVLLNLSTKGRFGSGGELVEGFSFVLLRKKLLLGMPLYLLCGMLGDGNFLKHFVPVSHLRLLLLGILTGISVSFWFSIKDFLFGMVVLTEVGFFI